ncbi:MAG: 23S rRNA (uracil(1939)-C(5))-methyltransferase RlmD [Clostridia bacterium]|nr:23S rRNA (uracil(1939)-C(5))-methyltransferase RlmD [Clostridia bacterium]
MVKNEEYTGTVCGLGTDGEGIINTEGVTVFVPYCLIGEEVRFKVLSVKGKIAYGKVLKVVSPSPDRVTPRCGVFEKCGGCSLQHMAYNAQLAFKGKTVQNALYKIGGIEYCVPPAKASPSPYAYRNKLAAPIGVLNGRDVIGFYAARSHRIVPFSSCAIQQEWSQIAIDCTLSFMRTYGVRGYDEEKKEGELRHLVARRIGGRYIVAVVSAKNVNLKPLADMLEKALGEVTLLLNINNKPTNAIFGDKFIAVSGDGFFTAEDMDIKFRAGANTFLQVNDGIRKELYLRIAEEAAEADAAIDLYSGGGMLTALLARACGMAYGIEVVKEASVCADELKELNGLQGKMFNICGKVEDELYSVLAATEGKKRVIVCDPPRKGMERSVVNAIKSSGAEKIILVSCNPATLARDLGLLTGTLKDIDGALVKCQLPLGYAANNGYKIECVQPYDMFPQTSAIETLVVLKRDN